MWSVMTTDKVQVGQRVLITELIHSRRSGQTGFIVEYRPSKKKIPSLDKCVVEFQDGERIQFWTIQVKPENDAKTSNDQLRESIDRT